MKRTTKSSVEELLETEHGACEFAKEKLGFEATELIAELMEKKHVSKAYVTQVLSGSRNITMHTLAGLTFALGHKVRLAAGPLTKTPVVRQYRTIEVPASGRRSRE